MAEKSSSSSTLIKKAVVAGFPLSIDKGEITDKGSFNQRIIIQNHPEAVGEIYMKTPLSHVIEVKM